MGDKAVKEASSPKQFKRENIYINHLVADMDIPDLKFIETKFDEQDDSILQTRRKRLNKVLIALLILAILGVGVLVYYFGNVVSRWVFNTVFDIFEFMSNFKEPWRSIIFALSSFFIQIFGIPIASLLVMIMSFCYSSILLGFSVGIVVCITANITMFFMFNAAKTAIETAEDTDQSPQAVKDQDFMDFLGKLMNSYIHSYPYRFGVMIRIFHLPDYAKMYLLVKYNTSFRHMLLPCVAVDSLNVLLYSFVGSQVKSKFDLLSSKSFHDKSLVEKIASIVGLVLVALQVVIMIGGFIYTRRKFKEFEQTGTAMVTPINRRSLASGNQTTHGLMPNEQDHS